jgi:hypothetical protein
MQQYMLFTCAPGFEMISIHDTVAEAKGHVAEELASKEGSSKTWGDWIGIMPISWSALTETVADGGSLESKGEIADAIARLDLRPSELEALAKEIGENCTTPQDHVTIQALKDAYAAHTGEDMADPYP